MGKIFQGATSLDFKGTAGSCRSPENREKLVCVNLFGRTDNIVKLVLIRSLWKKFYLIISSIYWTETNSFNSTKYFANEHLDRKSFSF